MNQPKNNTPQKVDNVQTAAHLNNQAGAPVNKKTQFETQIKAWFRVNSTRLRTLCGNEELANRILVAALNSVSRVPELVECTELSFTNALMQCAEYNLMPGFTGEAYILPFKKEATFVLGYFGAVQLLYRSGMVRDIEASVICAKDHFYYRRGSERVLEFEPAPGTLEERGEWLGVYCLIRNIFGGLHIAHLDAKEVAVIKSRSKGAASSFSPWQSKYVNDIAWMWMKTALKQGRKLAPASTKATIIHQAFDHDDNNDGAPTPLRLPEIVTPPAAPAQDKGTQSGNGEGASLES